MPGQNRIRDTKKYLENGVKNVDDKWENLGVISVFGHAIEENGVIADFAFTGPEGTNVERVLKQFPRDYLDKLLEASFLDNAEKVGSNQDEMITKKRKEISEVIDDYVKDDLPKPCKPIYTFSHLDMQAFFPMFVKAVLKRENIPTKGRTLWATKRKDQEGRELVTPPVQVPFWNKNIINPSFFFGMGKAYRFGNILQRQVMQVANILMLNRLDPDTYCERVPAGYTLEEVIALGSVTFDDEEDEVRNKVVENRKRNYKETVEDDYLASNIKETETGIEDREPKKKNNYGQCKTSRIESTPQDIEIAPLEIFDNVQSKERTDLYPGTDSEIIEIEVMEVKEEVSVTSKADTLADDISDKEEPKECSEEEERRLPAEDDSQMSITIQGSGHDPVQITLNRTRQKKGRGSC